MASLASALLEIHPQAHPMFPPTITLKAPAFIPLLDVVMMYPTPHVFVKTPTTALPPTALVMPVEIKQEFFVAVFLAESQLI